MRGVVSGVTRALSRCTTTASSTCAAPRIHTISRGSASAVITARPVSLSLHRPLACTQLARSFTATSASKQEAPSKTGYIDHSLEVPDRFAIFGFAGRQYKVTLNDVCSTEGQSQWEIGQEVLFDDVKMIGLATGHTAVGTPSIPNAVIKGIVEEHSLAPKVIVFKKKRRKGYKRWNGHRQQVTQFRITDIVIPDTLAGALPAPSSMSS